MTIKCSLRSLLCLLYLGLVVLELVFSTQNTVHFQSCLTIFMWCATLSKICNVRTVYNNYNTKYASYSTVQVYETAAQF